MTCVYFYVFNLVFCCFFLSGCLFHCLKVMGRQNCSYGCLEFVLDSTQPVIWSDLIHPRTSDFRLAWHLDQTMTAYILIFIHTVLLTRLHDRWDVLYYEAHQFPCWNYHCCGPQLMYVQPCCTWLTSDHSCSYCSLTLRRLRLLSGPKPCLVSATFSLWLNWIIQQHSSSSLIQRRKSVSECVRVSACVGVCVSAISIYLSAHTVRCACL